jgi:hypothetical protein
MQRLHVRHDWLAGGARVPWNALGGAMAGTRSLRSRGHLRVVDSARAGADVVASGASADDESDEVGGFRPAQSGIEASVMHAVCAWVALVREQEVKQLTIQQRSIGTYEALVDVADGSSLGLLVTLTLAPVLTLEAQIEPLRPA